MSTKLHQLTEVHWFDATGADGWISVNKLNTQEPLAKISTVGYFVKEDKDSLTLSMALDHDNTNYGAYMHIPKVNITKRRKLT